MQRWGSSMQSESFITGECSWVWRESVGEMGNVIKEKKHGRRGCGEAGGQYDASSDGGFQCKKL